MGKIYGDAEARCDGVVMVHIHTNVPTFVEHTSFFVDGGPYDLTGNGLLTLEDPAGTTTVRVDGVVFHQFDGGQVRHDPFTITVAAATNCQVTTTTAPTTSVAPPPPPPAPKPPAHHTQPPPAPPSSVTAVPPHRVEHELPATGAAGTGLLVTAAIVLIALGRRLNKWGRVS